MSEGSDELKAETKHPVWGPLVGECDRCGDPLYRRHPTRMCPDCVRETPGTDECPICADHGERICGYHATALWYCVECGMVRRIGNRPERPGSDATVHCPLDPSGVFEDGEHQMVRLCYESVAPPQLRRYHKQQSKRWNEHTRKKWKNGPVPQVVE